MNLSPTLAHTTPSLATLDGPFGFNMSHKKKTLERNKVTKMRVFPLKVMVLS
jgi:hypothetical protein